MRQNRWQIRFASVSIPVLILAAGCTGTDFIDSGNSNVSFEIVAVGLEETDKTYDCIQWAFGDLKLRPLDGTCAADSVNAGDPCLSGTDCDPLPGQTATCVGSEAFELLGNDGILVDPSPPDPGNILGGDCTPTIDAGGVCEGLFDGQNNAVRCLEDVECGFCEQQGTPCDTDAQCIGQDQCNQQAACVNPSRIVGAALVPPRSLILSAGVYEISELAVGRAQVYVDVPQPALDPPGPFFRGCSQLLPVVDSFGDTLRFTVLPDQDKLVRFVVDSVALEANLPAEDSCTDFLDDIEFILECDTCDAAP